MPRLPLVAAVLLALVLPAGHALADRPAPMGCTGTDRVRTCDVALPSDVRVRSSKVRVVVPAGYDTSDRDYPVVYVLHGVGDDYASWTNPSRGDLANLTATCDAIFVMPDGGGGTTAGWYSDWKDGRYQYETFHTAVLPRAVDAAFRTSGKKHRAIAGLSMGGFGALSYTARHPGMYAATASYSGFADTLFGAPASGAFYDAAGQNSVSSLGTPNKGIWGDQGSDRATWAEHNPYDLVESFRGQPLYLSSGHGAPGGSQGDDASKANGYGTEAYVGQLNDRLATALTERGIAYTDAREPGGRHDWPYWRANFTRSLKVLMPALDAATPGCGL
ncbi:MAG: esterase family protein [Actinobacteria bacterium]|nr:esterase family protein [Actinomycetota bacterium]